MLQVAIDFGSFVVDVVHVLVVCLWCCGACTVSSPVARSTTFPNGFHSAYHHTTVTAELLQTLYTAQHSVPLDALHASVRSLALPAAANAPHALQALQRLLPWIAALHGWGGQAQQLSKCLTRDLCLPLGGDGPLLSR